MLRSLIFALAVSAWASPSVTVNGISYPALTIQGASSATVSGKLVYGGFGDSISSAWSGNVVLLDRGGTPNFDQKVVAVRQAGGIGCIIANNNGGSYLFQLGGGLTDKLSAVSVNQADGAKIKAQVGSVCTIGQAPALTTAPVGTKIEISVTPEGTGPFTYQWSKGGVLIPNLSATMTIPSATVADSGTYLCKVTDANGQSQASGPYTITVGPTP